MKSYLIVLVLLLFNVTYSQKIESVLGGGRTNFDGPLDEISIPRGHVSPYGYLYVIKYDGTPTDVRIKLSTGEKENIFEPEFIEAIDENEIIYYSRGNQIFQFNPLTGGEELFAGNGDSGEPIIGENGLNSPLLLNRMAVGNGYLYIGLEERVITINIKTKIIEKELRFKTQCNSEQAPEFFFPSEIKVYGPENLLFIQGIDGTIIFDLENECVEKFLFSNSPGVAIDWQGNVYYTASISNEDLIFRYNRETQTDERVFFGLSEIAGECNSVFSLYGDISDIQNDDQGNIFVTYGAARFSEYITPTGSKKIGNGTSRFNRDDILAGEIALSEPHSLSFDRSGNMYVSETGNQIIRKIDKSGNVSVFAAWEQQKITAQYFSCTNQILEIFVEGNHLTAIRDGFDLYQESRYKLNGSALENDEFIETRRTELLTFGTKVYFFSNEMGLVKQIIEKDTLTNVERVIAGGEFGADFSEGMSALNLNFGDRFDIVFELPKIAIGMKGGLYLIYRNRVVRIDRVTRRVSLVAGSGQFGFSGDGGDPSIAEFDNPQDIAFDSNGDLYVADTGNDRIRKITGLNGTLDVQTLSVTDLVLVNPSTDKDIKKLEDLDQWFLFDYWRPNLRADVSSQEDVQSVTFTVNGKNVNVDNTWPYALGPNVGTDYKTYLLDQGVKTICATPHTEDDGEGESGVEKCVTLTLHNTLPDATRGAGTIESRPGSYLYGDIKKYGEYSFDAHFDRNERTFEGAAHFDFDGPDLTFNSSELIHFYQRKNKNTLFWYGEIGGKNDYMMEQRFLYRQNFTLVRIKITQLSSGEIIYDSQRGAVPWQRPDIVAMNDFHTFGHPIRAGIPEDLRWEENKLDLSVYPNPFADKIYLSSPESNAEYVEWRIVDPQGRITMKGKVTPGRVNELDVRHLPSGLYIISIRTEDHWEAFRLVK